MYRLLLSYCYSNWISRFYKIISSACLICKIEVAFNCSNCIFNIVVQLRMPLRAVSIVSIQMLIRNCIKFWRIDNFPVSLEFLWVNFKTIYARNLRSTFNLFLRQKVSFCVRSKRMYFLRFYETASVGMSFRINVIQTI